MFDGICREAAGYLCFVVVLFFFFSTGIQLISIEQYNSYTPGGFRVEYQGNLRVSTQNKHQQDLEGTL